MSPTMVDHDFEFATVALDDSVQPVDTSTSKEKQVKHYCSFLKLTYPISSLGSRFLHSLLGTGISYLQVL